MIEKFGLTRALFDSELGCGATKLNLFFESCILTTIARFSLGNLKNSATILVTLTLTHFPAFKSCLENFRALSAYGTDALFPWLFLVILFTWTFIVKWSSVKVRLFLQSNSWMCRLRMASSTSFWSTLLVNLKLITLRPLNRLCRDASESWNIISVTLIWCVLKCLHRTSIVSWL